MKRIIIIFMLINLFSCETPNYKDKLIGEWYLEDDARYGIRFTNDSLWIDSLLETVQTWDVDKERIYLHNQLDPVDYNKEFTYFINHDTLEWKAVRDTTNRVFRLIKVTDKYERYKKTIGFTIDLPSTEDSLQPIDAKYNKPHVFIGLKNGDVILKGTDKLMGLEHFRSFLLSIKYQLDKNEFNNEFIFNIYADKNITQLQMDTIKGMLKEFDFNRVFRIYQNDLINYKDNLNWYGKYE